MTSPAELVRIINNEYDGCAASAFQSVKHISLATWDKTIGLHVDCKCRRCNPMIRLFPGVRVHNNVLVLLLVGSALWNLFGQ